MGSGMEGGQVGTTGFYGEGQGNSGSNGGVSLKQESKEQVKRIGGLTRQRAFSTVDARKGTLVSGLNDFAQQLEGFANQAGQNGPQLPQQLIGSAVGFVRKASSTLENSSTEDLLRQAQTRMRERPAVALAGCALLGFVAARFLKA
ncbi:hypothetical protein FGE12_15950 [Aggregicoccus sp. 17bor-14]|uniref:hypothetical protein n=1 Tax=Myxococcaceae TaxID=31 RepID=UPI00129C8416|nr:MULTISPECIES: hypothetical protein [Myxococcaceae]MBF5043894.1 hypothetical protein [Simulacricoccus sp. 17bor-14]MRI89645.1 hypothetical protein [Aggregicoccus sp. 17bor-14]